MMRTALDAAAEIRLVVNADDFGMSPAISRGILRAHREGIVTSTSLLGNCADLDAGARAAGRGARAWAWACTWRWSAAARSRTPARVPSLLTAGGRLSRRAAPSSSPRWTKRQIDAGRRRTRVRRADRARARRRASRSITWTRTTTSAFSRSSGRTVEAVARGTASAAIRSAIETPTLSWVTDPRRGLKAGVLTGLGWLTRRQLGARRHSAAELGLRRIGPPRRGARPRDHRPPRARARTSSSATRARSSTPFYDHAGELTRADVGEGAPRARTARRHPVPLGGSVLSGARDSRRPPARPPPRPSLTSRRRTSIGRADRQGDRAGHGVRRDLRRGDRLPGAEGGPDGVGVDPDRGAGDLGVQEARLVDDPREQHRPDHRLGGRVDRRRRRLHPARLPVSRRAAPRRARRRRAVLLVLDDPDAGDGGRRARRADDDPAAALADRPGAREPPLPRRDGVRVGADRRREGRQPGAHGVPSAWASRSCTRCCSGSCASSPRRRRWRSSRRTATCRRRSSAATSRPSTWASATSSARASPACWSRAACSPGWG